MIKFSENQNIKYGVILSYVVMFISLIGTFFVTNKILILVGDYDYGLYSFTNSVTSWLTVVSSALTASYLRFATIEEKRDNLPRVNSLYLLMLAIIGLITLVLGVGISLILLSCKVNIGNYSWYDSQKIYYLTIASVINISLTMPFSVHALFINFRKKFIFAKTVQVFITILTYIFQFIIAYTTQNVIYISYFTILITIINFIFNYIYSKRVLNINFIVDTLKNNIPLFKSIIIFSGIIIFNSVVDQINTTVDKIILGLYSTPENVTIYQLGQQFNVYLVTMSVSICSVYSPSLHKLICDEKNNSLNDLFLKISSIQALLMSFICFGFLSTGKYFISWWIGNDRIEVFYIASILLLIDICPLSINASIEIQRARNKHLFRAILYFFVAIFNVIISLCFLNIFDIKYAIYACLLGSVIARILSHWVLMNIYNKKIMKLPIGTYLIRLFQYMILAFIAVIITYLINNYLILNYITNNIILIILNGIIFTILYAVFLYITNFKIVNEYFKTRVSKCYYK